MDLSIIIVNYNVRHFLEQCLETCCKAIQGLSAEIIVVDNNSVDQSCEMVKNLFPSVKLISSTENYGFAKANNIGLKMASGKFILFLNPDTIIAEDCFKECLDFMKAHPDAGAVGVKMIDGSGNYLPESKRGFPTPWVSFCKMTGLYKLFPKSRRFNGYYLGHKSENEVAQIDVLTGAFFFTRKSILDKIGGFDESYFMYGEDIDLSYSIQQLNFNLYYFPITQIIHFKGESTKKSSLNYWNSFYHSMLIFYNKYHPGNSFLFHFLIKTAIIFKGILSFSKSMILRSGIFLFDGIFIWIGSYLIKDFWSQFFHGTPFYFQSKAIFFNTALYCFIWLVAMYLNGIYDRYFKLQDIIVSSIVGFIANLSVYALIPENLRSSRMILALVFIWVLFYFLISRFILSRISRFNNRRIDSNNWSILIIGDLNEEKKIRQVFQNNEIIFKELYRLETNSDMGNTNWSEVLKYFNADEIIFCPSFGSTQKLLNVLAQIPGWIQVKILNPSGTGIIGSSDKKSAGELYTLEMTYNLQKEKYKHQKRFFDIIFSLLLLGFSWIIIFLQKNKKHFFLNIFNVLIGSKTWVNPSFSSKDKILHPILKPGVLEPLNDFQKSNQRELVDEVYKNYLWNYSIWMDLDICLKEIQSLDRDGNVES